VGGTSGTLTITHSGLPGVITARVSNGAFYAEVPTCSTWLPDEPCWVRPYAPWSSELVSVPGTLTLRFDEFWQLCEEHSGVQGLLVRMLAQRVDRLSTHLIDALYLPADRRVLRTLVDLCGQYSDRARSGEVTLPLTQVDVAELSGASRPTTNRYLRRLEEEGLVRLNRGHVTVLDVEALRAVSER